MPSINMQELARQILNRKKWQQVQMLHGHDHSEVTLSRIMGRTQTPKFETFEKLMDSLEAPSETLYVLRLENATPNMLALHEGIMNELERVYYHPPALAKAKEYLAELVATGNFDEGMNKQFALGYQLWIALFEGQDAESVAVQALEGLRMTYPEFSAASYKGELLIVGEPQLLHVYACALSKIKPAKAIDLLYNAIAGIEQTPHDETSKEKMLAPLALDLVKTLTAEKRYTEALDVCDTGNDASIRRNKGKYTPDFVYYKAMLLNQLGKGEAAQKLLLPVFFGYIALGRYDDAQNVKAYAQRIGYDMPTYGAESMQRYEPDFTIERGSYIKGRLPGDFIRHFRTEANIGQKELCDGICPVSTLSKIESGQLRGTVYQLEALMQRLGRNIEYYFTTFLPADTFEEKQVRDEVRTRLVDRQYEQAEELLNKLKKFKDYQSGLGRQFVLSAEAAIHSERHGYDDRHMDLLMQAWKITREKHKIDTAHRLRLTNEEITILNKIAIHFCFTGEQERGIRLYEGLRNNLNFLYVDETERMRTYIMVSSNLAAEYGRVGRYQKELLLADEGFALCIKYGNIKLAFKFASCKAFALAERGKKNESIPYVAMHYYVATLLGRTSSQEAARKYVANKKLDIILF